MTNDIILKSSMESCQKIFAALMTNKEYIKNSYKLVNKWQTREENSQFTSDKIWMMSEFMNE